MDIDAVGAPMVASSFSSGKQHEEEKEEAVPASTTLDVRNSSSSADDGDTNDNSTTSTDGMTPTQQLLFAAEKGDCALIRAAITRGADVKVHDMGPKVQAEEKRRLEEAAGVKKTKKQLLAEEKEQETMFRDMTITEDTALHKAAEKGHAKAVDLLFYAEADIEAKNRLGSTPLHRAVSAKQQDVVALLLRHGARLDAVNAIGNTALHIASYQGDVEMAQLLIGHAKHEAYRLVVAVNQAGVTPIDYARKKQMHTLLSSHRLLSSATSSFVRGPVGEHPADPTPKNGRMMVSHLSGNSDAPPQLSRPNSWGKTAAGEEGRQTPVHHHAPNPPISHHSVAQQASNQPTPSIASRPLAQANDHDSATTASNTIASTSTSSASSSSIAPALLPNSTFSSFNGPSHSTSSSHSTTQHSAQQPAATTAPQLHPSTQTAAATTTLSDPAIGELPSLITKPSFEKTSSLDSHPLESERRQGSISTVGQMVSPVLAGRAGESVGSAGSLSVNVEARGVSMGGLSLNMLPNAAE